MKKALSLLIAVAVLAAGTTAMAAMAASKHDMTSYGAAVGSGANATGANKEICVYCHTPHNASRNRALWNRNNSTETFNLFTSGAIDLKDAWFKSGSSSANITSASASLMCLSCHDGITSISAQVINKGAMKVAPALINALVTGNANLGTDLRNDHPINMDYTAIQADSTMTGKFNAAVNGKVGDAKLINGTDLECASCHDVHSLTYSPFLRDTMTGSALCLDCHNK